MTFPLSPMEQEILDLLPESGEQVTSAYLAEKIYARRDPPKHPRVVVMGMVQNLARMGEIGGFRVRRTARAGQWPVKIWKEKIS